jgi:hypothetical protein
LQDKCPRKDVKGFIARISTTELLKYEITHGEKEENKEEKK